MNRFNGHIPHIIDTNLLERCQEEIRNFDINYKGWVEPRDHTLSYISAAYLELAARYDSLKSLYDADNDVSMDEDYFTSPDRVTADDLLEEALNNNPECCGGGCHSEKV